MCVVILNICTAVFIIVIGVKIYHSITINMKNEIIKRYDKNNILSTRKEKLVFQIVSRGAGAWKE